MRAWIWLAMALAATGRAETNQPYIDQLKATMPEKATDPELGEPGTQSYTEALKKKLRIDEDYAPAESQQSFIDRLRQSDNKEVAPEGAFLSSEQARIQQLDSEKEPKPSVIESVKAGTAAELKMQKPSGVSKAFGFRMGAWMNVGVTSTSSYAAFNTVYPGSWAPDIQLTAEWQLLQHDHVLALGVQGQIGASIWRGTGTFANSLTWPDNTTYATQAVGSSSRVSLGFVSVPISVGPVFRLNVLRVLRPYIYVGGLFIPYFETRSDSVSGNRGYSIGANLEGGVAIQMDAFDRSAEFEMWDAYAIKHVYLTASYQMIFTFSSPVSFNNSGIYAGILAEF